MQDQAQSPHMLMADKEMLALNEHVAVAVRLYFEQLNGHATTNLYAMLLNEIEPPLLKATLDYVNGNQSRAADILGMNRGTLRKKLKLYGLISK